MENNHTPLSAHYDSTTFRCQPCQYTFDAVVDRVEERPDVEIHRFEYFCPCPQCQQEATEAAFMKNLRAAWLNPTGTGSPEISAQNLPDPMDPRRRFGALKHGMYAQKAKYFPARVGGYPECDGCEYITTCEEGEVCLSITKMKMLVTRAFDSKNPNDLQPLFQDIQSDTFVLLKRMINQVLADGAVLYSPVFTGGKEGYDLVEDKEGNQLIQTEVHPAIKAISELIQKNGLSLSDLQMTPKTQVDQAMAMGNLQGEKEERMTREQMHKERQDTMNEFLTKLSTAPAQREKDPHFQEQQEESL